MTRTRKRLPENRRKAVLAFLRGPGKAERERIKLVKVQAPNSKAFYTTVPASRVDIVAEEYRSMGMRVVGIG